MYSTPSSPTAGPANNQKFVDVGYGQTGVDTGGGPPQASFPLVRRMSVQTFHPGNNDLVGVIHGLGPQLLMLKANPSPSWQRLWRRFGRTDLPRRARTRSWRSTPGDTGWASTVSCAVGFRRSITVLYMPAVLDWLAQYVRPT